jgi:ATP-dependent RNA helicase DHX8/PRP22
MLPIHEYHEEIITTIRNNQVTIVVGETGSGKTTQLPLFLYEACFSKAGIIGITEPRRIAASSVARYVAGQLKTEVGNKVGYQVRFDDMTSPSVKVKFMTDGILLNEIQKDPDLMKYSVIMVDEAHERNVNTDFTLGLLKKLVARRPDIKVVISSATIDTNKFSSYFSNAPIVTVSGRTFPVRIVWDEQDYPLYYSIHDAVVKKIVEIHKKESAGDILVFMAGQDDIERVVKALKKMQEEPPAEVFGTGLAGAFRLQAFGGKSMQQIELENLVVLPVHGGLSSEEQQLIFQQFPGKRKVIVATNIAETSITIDGVVYVIDTGRIKETHFNSQSGIQSLDLVEHSQSGCMQRAGRAGRTQPGVCYRMFTERNFQMRPIFTQPEILRMSLAGVVLSMEEIGITDVENFEFIDQPNKTAFHEAYETLRALGAVETTGGGLTPLGHSMARLPLEPRISRMVLEAVKHGCVEEVATVAAFLQVRNIFLRPKGQEYQANEAQRKFKSDRSDALTYLNVWNEYEASKFNKDWCFANFLSGRSLWEIKSIRDQLISLLRQREWEITSTPDENAIVRSVAAGLVNNLLGLYSRHAYNTTFRSAWQEAYIHPGSSVFGRYPDPRWVVAAEIKTTSKTFALGVSEVKLEWLPEIAPVHFRFGNTELVGYTKGDNFVKARRPIIEKASERTYNQEREAGNTEVKVTLEEARRIQEARIREAEDKGLVRAQFTMHTKRVGWYDEISWVASVGGRSYKASYGMSVEAENSYYCKIESHPFGLSDGVIVPVFEIFKLG